MNPHFPTIMDDEYNMSDLTLLANTLCLKGKLNVESPQLIPSSVFYGNPSAFLMNCSREIQHHALELAQMVNVNKLKLALLVRICLHFDCLTKTSCNPLQMTSFVPFLLVPRQQNQPAKF